MASKSRERRLKLAGRFAESATLFYPERVGMFLCPTCLTWVGLDDQKSITEAHIIPDAVGGRLVTLLCRSCNSAFGTKRDKWFGEYIRVFRQPNVTLLHVTEQRGYFDINGVRVGGTFSISAAGVIELLIDESRTSPEGRAAVANLAAPGRWLSQDPADWDSSTVTVTLPTPPVVVHKDSVTIGFLTAAYLLWFRALGYSWVLQNHLGLVRRAASDGNVNGAATRVQRSVAAKNRSSLDWVWHY